MNNLTTDAAPINRNNNSSSGPTVREDPKNINISHSSGVHIGPVINAGLLNASGQQKKPTKSHVEALLHCSRVLDSDDMDDISTHLGRKWKEVGIKMEYSLGQLECIEDECRALYDCGYKLMNMWRDKMSMQGTVANVTRHLMNSNAYDSVRNLKP